MSVAAFDTLKYARQLKQAGLPEPQAEAMTVALADARVAGIQELATKRDLEQLRQELKADNKGFEQKMIAGFERLEQQIKSETRNLEGQFTLLKWMFAVGFSELMAMFVRMFFFSPH